ncbi:hypothetical protein F5Y09DRAFT_344883 [Xylaria sp. FL1042]|nr:hypothetical protein F5Y09DRAFT_344883 [Xylaria sp. FL1042]
MAPAFEFLADLNLGPSSSSSAAAAAAAGGGGGGGGGGEDLGCRVVQHPCSMLLPAPGHDPMQGINYANPCETGGCLQSQHCASGGCRLDELGGRWVCCRCHGRGNTFKWCAHRVRGVPDALCYHVVCNNCRMDD